MYAQVQAEVTFLNENQGAMMTILSLNASSLADADASEMYLIACAQRGEAAAFAEIFEKYKRRVYSLCLRMTRAPADAEDLTQDVFLLLFRKISSFRGESAFSTWLHRIVTNVVLMHLRKKSRPQVSLDDIGASPDEPKRREVGAHDLRLQNCVDRITLQRAIANLPPGYRAVYALYELHGYGHREIAEIMDWSVGNSKSQLHKARRKLRAWLRSCRTRPLPAELSKGLMKRPSRVALKNSLVPLGERVASVGSRVRGFHRDYDGVPAALRRQGYAPAREL